MKHASLKLFANILLVACLGSIATDIYTPSIPAISTFMQVPVTTAQLSLTIFLFGLAFSQLVYGPISEGIGRRRPLLAGLLIFCGGSVLCMRAGSMEWLLTGRLLQGIGAGACASLWRSIFRDVYQGDDLSRYGSWLSIVVTMMVPAIPVLGGVLQTFSGWRANFVFLIGYSALTMVLVALTLPETSVHHHRSRLQKTFVVKAFCRLFSSRVFMGNSLIVFFCYGGFFSWIATGPVLLVENMGLTPVAFGWVSFVIGAGAMSLGGWVNGFFVKKMGGVRMLRAGFSIMFVAGMLLFALNMVQMPTLIGLAACVFLYSFGVTLVWPNAFAGAFTPFGDIAGYAGALYSFIQLGGGACIGSLVTLLPAHSSQPLSVVFMLSAMAAAAAFEGLVNGKNIFSLNMKSV